MSPLFHASHGFLPFGKYTLRLHPVSVKKSFVENAAYRWCLPHFGA